MPQHEDTRKKFTNSDLSATVPDIFASIAAANEFPEDSTCMDLLDCARIKFPGNWQESARDSKRQEKVYKRQSSISAVISIGKLSKNDAESALIARLCSGEPRAFQENELAVLLPAISGLHSSEDYELTAGSSELLADKMIIVLQGLLPRIATKEAVLIFPDGKRYGVLSLKAIKPEFPVYFNHLRQALQSLEWR